MNIQLNLVISDITGVTGLNIIQAILQGTRDPQALANLSVGGCRKNIDLIRKALEGNFRKEHVFALGQAFEAYEFFQKQIRICEETIEKLLPTIQIEPKMPPLSEDSHSKKCARKTAARKSPYYFNASAEIKKITKADLTTIPGIDANTAMKILSEVETDMSRWSNTKAFASCLALSPGNKISGGKVLSSRTKPSDNRAAQTLRMAAATTGPKQHLELFFEDYELVWGRLKRLRQQPTS